MENNNINKPLIIIGGAGHGCIVEACVLDNRKHGDLEWDIKGFCNDYDSEVDGFPVLGKLCDIPRLMEEGYYFSWAIHLIANNRLTAKMFDSLNIPDDRWATIVHHTAFIADSVRLGPGAFVMYNAYIAPRTTIGKCTMIKANTNIGHDVVIGEISHIAMGAAIVSCVKIGRCADVAVGSTVLANTEIGDYAMVGASSLLTHGKVEDGQIYSGIPAKYLKDMPHEP